MLSEAYAKVKPATNPQGVLAADASVIVENGYMWASNGVLTACQPCDLPDFAVPAVDLDFALRKLSPDCTVSVGKTQVVLKGGGETRLGLTLASVIWSKPEIEAVPVDQEMLEDLADAIDDVWPFSVGDTTKPWSVGARLDGNLLTATNSTMLCRAELARDTGITGITLPRVALAHIRQRREDIVAWGYDDKGLLLEFSDGGWAFASRMTVEMPSAAVHLVTGDSIRWDGPLQKITEAYRGSLLAAVDYTEELLYIHPDHIYGARLASEREVPVKTVLDASPAIFDAKELTAVISRATEAGFDRYPAPVPFKTKRGSLGLLSGRKPTQKGTE